MTTTSQAIQVCEAVLQADLEYNQTNKIWPSVNRVIERMLGRRNELCDAYEELHESLAQRPHALKSFFDILTSTPVAWSPEKITEARQARKELTGINAQIAAAAVALAQLLTRRDEIKEGSSFSCDTLYHPLDVLNAAENAEVYAQDPATDSATEGRRPGLSDFLKAFFTRLKENSVREHGFIPNNLSVSDNTVASLVNCALDLNADKLIDGDFVKRFRQRERER